MNLDFTQEDLDLAIEDMSADLDAAADKDTKDEVDAAEESLAAAFLMDAATESEIAELCESADEMVEVNTILGVGMERTIVRFDRKSRLAHLSKQAELNEARKANDPNYKKLLKIWMMERALEDKIHQRYASKAKSIANRKIRDYAANGKKIQKPNPSTVAYKGKVSGKIAQKAVANSKKMFSNGAKTNASK